MPRTLSTSTRYLLGGLLVLLLLAQLGFSTTFIMAQAYAHNGRISHENNNWEYTILYYTNANQWYPYSQHWNYSIGVGHKELGRWEESIDAMEQGLICSPYFVLGLNSAATLQYRVKNFSVAEHLVGQAEALVPYHWEVNRMQGLLLNNSGKTPEAVTQLLFTRRNALTPQPAIESLLAYTASNMKRYDLALEAVNTIIRLEPGTSRHWLQKGKIHRHLNQSVPAIQAYQKALEVYGREQNKSPIQQSPRTMLENEPIQAHIALGELYVEAQDYKKSIEAFHAVANMYANIPKSAETMDTLALRAKQTPPADPLRWACVLSAGGRWAEAEALFSEVDFDQADETDSVERYHYAMALRHVGKLEASLVQFRAMNSRPFIPACMYADTLRVAGQPAAARFEYSKVLTFYNASVTDQQRSDITKIIAQLTPKTPKG